MLTDIYSKKAVSLPNAAASNYLPLELKPWLSLSKQDQQSVVLFSGAVIQAEQLTVKIKPWISRKNNITRKPTSVEKTPRLV